MTPYYSDDHVTIYHGDCTDLLRRGLGVRGQVDLVFTSPPYNLGTSEGRGHWKSGQDRGGYGRWTACSGAGIGYDEHDDAMPAEAYATWQAEVLGAAWDLLAEDGAIFYNHKPRPMRTLWHPRSLIPAHIDIRQEIVWFRRGGMNFATTHYLPTYELIFVLAKDAWRLKSKGASGVGDVWDVAPESNSQHPAPFPLSLPAMAIETVGPRLVLDPFCGSGTTLRAAKDANVKAVGIEKSERYCEIAAKRCAQEVLAL